ncbi:hypothetical protein Pryu01_00265 [Paraliobacillus ryukyuensis]|uniref:Uncharacterized protein n=1 Tax=Paraliobacillus ryukyuensis TaxID=200904 RepID=A0A366EH55_9BACI|nr:hypothetical protein DES48_101406 [Paraliobacillus ryukyuensis]
MKIKVPIKERVKIFIISPYKLLKQDFQKDKLLIKEAKEYGIKINLYPFKVISCMFVFVTSILYIYFIYIIFGGLFVSPLVFIGLLPNSLSIWVFILIYTKLYPKVKENYLKHVGFYDEY